MKVNGVKIWMDGGLMPAEEANIPFLNTALHYGLGVFEGIRCYETERGPAVFRLREHMERLVRSARILGDLAQKSAAGLSSAVRDELGIAKAFMDLYARAAADPSVMAALSKLSTQFRQIFLITHIEDVKDSMNYVIRVTEQEDGTSRAELAA